MRWKQELSCHEATVLTTWRYRSVLSLKIDFSRWMIPSKVSSVWNVFRLNSVSRYCGYQHKTSNMKGWVCFSFLWFYFKKKTTEITETFPMCEKRCMQFLGRCNEAPPQAALTHRQRLQRLMLSIRYGCIIMERVTYCNHAFNVETLVHVCTTHSCNNSVWYVRSNADRPCPAPVSFVWCDYFRVYTSESAAALLRRKFYIFLLACAEMST